MLGPSKTFLAPPAGALLGRVVDFPLRHLKNNYVNSTDYIEIKMMWLKNILMKRNDFEQNIAMATIHLKFSSKPQLALILFKKKPLMGEIKSKC